MRDRIIGLETEYALLHYPDPARQIKGLTGTELFEIMNGCMDDAEIVRLYEEKFYPESRGEAYASYDDRRRYSMKKNRMFLANGARFYLDTGDHPEYATPECLSVLDLVAHDKAGERMLADLAARAQQVLQEREIGGEILICKNNVDIRGNTFGCHENYLIPRRSPRHNESSFFKLIIKELIPFLITRQIFTGTGKVFTGNKLGFQISQRADFIDSELSSDTTFRRGIINSRDEPLGKIDKYRRLHILIGDSNLSEFTSFLKVGTTKLVLDVIEATGIGEEIVLEDPILALREISHDPQCKVKVKLVNGRYKSAIEIQRYYLDKVLKHLEESGEINKGEAKLIVHHWKRILDGVESNSTSLDEEIDWKAKLSVTDRFIERNNTSYQELNRWVYFIKRMKSLRLEDILFKQTKGKNSFDLEKFLKTRVTQGDFIELKRHMRYSEIEFSDYFRIHKIYHNLLKLDIVFHDIRKDQGLYYKMLKSGQFKPFRYPDISEELKVRYEYITEVVTSDDPFSLLVDRAKTTAPMDTRANIRSLFVKRMFGHRVRGAVNWDSVLLHDKEVKKVSLMDPFSSSNSEVEELLDSVGPSNNAAE